MDEARRGDARAAAVVALVAFLPFLRGALAGASLYFRDLSLHFLPLRRFALEGLRAGEVRWWNPLVHEGVPLSLPALGYPLDLLQLLRPDEAGHLARPRRSTCRSRRSRSSPSPVASGCPARPPPGAALVYALGGFLLSTVNLYVYAPGCGLGAARGPRLPPPARAAPPAGPSPPPRRRSLVALSTTGVEIVAQALAGRAGSGRHRARSGPAPRSRRARPWRSPSALALAAPVLLLVAGQVAGSARGRGFPTDVVLAHSVHPFTLVQTVVAGLYGNPSNLAGRVVGAELLPARLPLRPEPLPRGGGPVPRRRRRVLPPLARARAARPWRPPASSSRWVAGPGSTAVVDALPVAPLVPLSGQGVLHRPPRRRPPRRARPGDAARALPPGARGSGSAFVAGGLGVALAAAPLLPAVAAGPAASFAAAFFPPGFPPEARAALLARVLDGRGDRRRRGPRGGRGRLDGAALPPWRLAVPRSS